MTDNTYPIDVFIPWVNPDDDKWYLDYCEACKTHIGDKSPQRIRDFGTFRYLLRSIDKNMPWVNKIHILLYSKPQIPDWLNVFDSRIEVHTHTDICNASFNQLYFTRFIGNIKDLAEHFIYLCDDQIILKPMQPEDWFVNGVPIDDAATSLVFSSNPCDEANLIKQGLTYTKQISGHTLDFFQRIVKNSIFLAGAVTGNVNIYKNPHVGISCLKSEYARYMNALANQLDLMFKDYWFRTDSQVIPHWLYRYIRLTIGNYVQHDMSDRIYREITTSNVDFIYNDYNRGYKLCCLNDILRSDDSFKEAKQNVCNALHGVFPDASRFESQMSAIE